MPTDKRSTTYRLSEEARTLLDQLSGHHGITQTAVLEMAIRQMARQDLAAAGAQREPPAPPAKKKRKEK